jgi:branched-chain amino acid transport system ATP-binding protein
MNAFDIKGLTVRHGGAIALDRVDLSIDRGELVALIGPNGAGKSTLVKALCGLLTPDEGTIGVNGEVAPVLQGRELFGDLSVDDNLRLGGWRLGRSGRDTGAIYDLFPGLFPVRDKRASTLSGGQQQMVAIGRALMARPDLLVVDELSLGLAPLVVAELVDHLRALNHDGLAGLLIEQNARLALGLCSRAYVIESGRIVLEGPSAELAGDPRVIDAYLGGPGAVTA